MTYNTKTGKEEILRIWITTIRHGGLGHEVVVAGKDYILYFEGRVNGGFFVLRVWGAYISFGGAYTWRGLFSEFYAIFPHALTNEFLTSKIV